MKTAVLAILLAALSHNFACADVRVGWAGPITGSAASIGEKNREGVKQAVDDINAAGGVLGHRLVIQFEDDAADPKQAVSVANRLVADGVQFIIGHQTSGAPIPASDVYAESGIVMVSPAATNPLFTERELWNVFRVCGRDDQQGVVAGTYLAKHFAGKNVFIVNDKTPYGVGLTDEVRRAMNAEGLKEVGYEGITAGEKDYSALVAKIKETKAEALYFGGFYTEAGLIARQLHDTSYQLPIFGGDALFSSEFSTIAGESANGAMITWGPDSTKNPAAAEVVQRFRQRGVEPEGLTLYGYAAVQVIAKAIEAAHTIEQQLVADKIHSGVIFDTVIGPLSFNQKGDITRTEFVFYQLTDGKFVEMPSE